MAQLLKGFSIFSLASFGWGCSGILVFILILVVCLHKWKKQTVIFLQVCGCILLFGVMPVAAVFCGVNVNGYLSAEGGIFGKIKTSLGINTGKVSTDTFEVSELNLRLDENGEYSAIVRVNIKDAETTLKINPNKKYALLVNGALTSDNFMSTTGENIALSADYTYAFNDFQRKEIAKDTLHIAFMLNKDDIVCRLSTEGGAAAKDLWKLYYRKNGMKIKFVESNYEKPPIISEGGGDVSNIVTVRFLDKNNEVLSTKLVDVKNKIDYIPTIDNILFKGWTVDGTAVLTNEQIKAFELSEDIDFKAVFASEVKTQVDSISSQNPYSIQWSTKDSALSEFKHLTTGYPTTANKNIKIADFGNSEMKISKFRLKISELQVIDKNGNIFYAFGNKSLSKTPITNGFNMAGDGYYTSGETIEFSDSSSWTANKITLSTSIWNGSYGMISDSGELTLYMRACLGEYADTDRYNVYSVTITSIEVWLVPKS